MLTAAISKRFHSSLTSSILLHVEAAQETNGLIPSPAALDFKSGLDVAAITAARRVRSAESAATVRQLGGPRRRMGRCRLTVGIDWQRVGVDAENASGAAKLIVDGAKVDLLDAKLAKERGTHHARLHRDVEDALP